MNPVLKGYLRLCRPPNLPTAAADILAGLSIAGYYTRNMPVYGNDFLLIFASVFLYAGGVVLNDVFDAKLDSVERPERPIPSGLISLKNARIFGFTLLVLGILLASLVSMLSMVVAIGLACSILAYDAFSKNFSFLGPFNMGICRALNLLLGITVFQSFTGWAYTLIPLLFIFAVTLVSRGEVHGNNKKNIVTAGILYTLVILMIIILHKAYGVGSVVYLIMLIGFALMVFTPLRKAYLHNIPKNIMKAVKAGVLSIVLIDAAIAVAHSNWQIGMLIVLFLPLSILLARLFAVT